jgi:predicted nucleic acid-binding protein
MSKAAISASGEFPLTSEPPNVVLDTNVVLDWLLFADPSVQSLAAAVTRRHLRWLATAAMHDEFAHVLGRGLATAHGADSKALGCAFRQHCTEHPDAPPAPARLRCSDSDDQKFIDLALAGGARWLVSRDRALLKLRRPAHPLGLAIVTPDQWRQERDRNEKGQPAGCP